MGGALIDVLVQQGVEVIALSRTDLGDRTLKDRGVSAVVRADLGETARWDHATRDVDVIFHLGLPRLTPPVRSRHIKRLAAQAEAGATIVGGLADGRPVVMATCAMSDASGPLAIARPGLAAQRALEATGARARIVRLPWAYGASGFICDMSRGLQLRRFRVVGPGTNTIALVGARDAATALVAAASAPAGVYTVAEDDMPTQEALVHYLCGIRDAPRPDHLPPSVARVSMGGVIVDALTADQRVVVSPPPGFAHEQRWRDDLDEALRG